MRKTSGPIVTYTVTELAAKRADGARRSNWDEAARKSVPDGSDPDDAIDDADWLAVELPAPRRKSHASLRIDADVLDWFRAHGKGYQTKINAVLRSYYEQKIR